MTAPQWSVDRATAYAPSGFAPALAGRLRAALAAEHARWPFTPGDARGGVGRVRHVAERLGLDATVVRGGLDVGGAELDHIWTVVEQRVVDPSLPVHSDSFVAVLRAFVAGDVEAAELDHHAHGYRLEWRVLGEYPSDYRYVGRPVWTARS